jgi:DNA polymerase III delta prime subunit
MTALSANPGALLARSIAEGRVHSSYLMAGATDVVRAAAQKFARALVCTAEGTRPCEACRECHRSSETESPPVEIDGAGKRGPLFRHVGDHPDLYWIDRGPDGTRVRIGQVRAVQHALRLGSHEGGWRVAVIADAEWLNAEAQNSLLKLLEEPPDRTCLVLASASAAPLAATIRSRCQRIQFPLLRDAGLRGDDLSPERASLVQRFDAMPGHGLSDLLDWAEEFRGNRAKAAEGVEELLEVGSEWMTERVRQAAEQGHRNMRRELDAFRTLMQCRKDLVQRNANPQMVAERALLSVRAVAS